MTRKVPELHLDFAETHAGAFDPKRAAVTGDQPLLAQPALGQERFGEQDAESRLARLKDLYAAMTEANEAILHSKDLQILLPAIARIALAYGHFSFVRILLFEANGTRVHGTGRLDVAASAGVDPGVFQPADPGLLRGPLGEALHTGTRYISNDALGDPSNMLARDTLRRTGIRAQGVFLLRRQGRVAGAMELYSLQPSCFDDELVGLLDRLAANLSFALDNFHREEARAAAEVALRESENRFRDFAEAAGEFVWETDLNGRFKYISSGVQTVWEYTDQELIGRSPLELSPADEAERVRGWLRENMRPDGSFRDLEQQILTRSGDIRWLTVHAVGVYDGHGRRLGQRGTCRDITDRKQAHVRMSYLATRDPLTELPNRVLFNDRLEQAIVAARRSGQRFAVLFIDLDRFKYINDSLGHQVGDLLLKEVAARMLGCIRKGDTLARLGGDEFVATLEGLQQAEDAAQVADKIIRTLSRPFELAGHTLVTSCSIGISSFPYDGEDGRGLMQNADTAMYHAKERGRNNYQFFSTAMNARAVERQTLEMELRQALQRRQFVLHYQPRLNLRNGELVGLEVLLRWQHPQRGLLFPAAFVNVAEESGLMESIGYWVIQQACRRAKQWQLAGLRRVKVAVNLSARELAKARRLARSISRILTLSGLDPRHLTLEMSESLLLNNAEENLSVLKRLGERGVRIAVDDFGSGYSSLSHLRQLPIETLKIDRSVIAGLPHDPSAVGIVKAIIALAHSLGVSVTAEGVESPVQLDALAELGCDEYQGNLVCEALDEVEVEQRFLRLV
ncbi:MAG TPA: EAL domain-containing protein [Burkholderiales bacterium]|nr:EAL domain-containing protein [Burkholderiales bacterium]